MLTLGDMKTKTGIFSHPCRFYRVKFYKLTSYFPKMPAFLVLKDHWGQLQVAVR